MRHRIHGKQLCRDSEHRTAMLRNLAAGLFEHGQIETTMPKAKAVQPFVEKIITIAKRGGFNSRKRIEQMINDRKIHSWVADPNVPDSRKQNDHFDLPSEDLIQFNRYGEVRKAPRLVQHILTTIGPKFADRDGGYTRIIKIGKHRLGDGTDLVVLQLVGEEEGPQISGGDSRRRTQKQRRRDFAAKVFVPTPAEETPAQEVDEAVVEETSVDDAVETITEETGEDQTTVDNASVEETPVETAEASSEESSEEEPAESPAEDLLPDDATPEDTIEDEATPEEVAAPEDEAAPDIEDAPESDGDSDQPKE